MTTFTAGRSGGSESTNFHLPGDYLTPVLSPDSNLIGGHPMLKVMVIELWLGRLTSLTFIYAVAQVYEEGWPKLVDFLYGMQVGEVVMGGGGGLEGVVIDGVVKSI